jgi:hypothetical protein
MKPVTKSRFKLGLECTNKEYGNQKNENPFLQALV